MKPLERMAEAIDAKITAIYGSPLDSSEGNEIARAALLALAEAEFDPDGPIILPAVLDADDSDAASTSEHALFAFRAICRSIAKEGVKE